METRVGAARVQDSLRWTALQRGVDPMAIVIALERTKLHLQLTIFRVGQRPVEAQRVEGPG
jgi:hypothetical protein